MGNNNMGKLAIVFKEKWNRFSHYLRNIFKMILHAYVLHLLYVGD